MKHQQHMKMKRPKKGFFSRIEISILGTNCENIKNISNKISKQIKQYISVTYVDKIHGNDDFNNHENLNFLNVYTDKISHHEYLLNKSSGSFEEHFFDSGNLTIINGNHNSGINQIVMIDQTKKISLLKKKKNLTNVIAFIGKDLTVPDYISDCIKNSQDIPFFLENDLVSISSFITSFVSKQITPLNGLILSGGESLRMGTNKAAIEYRGIPQHQHLNQLLKPFCDEVYVSCRKEQVHLFDNTIEDSFIGMGPTGGILSAFRKNPNVAWLSVACDIPLLNYDTILKLTKHRNPMKMATCFYNSTTKFPEPLITIWEPRALSVLLYFLSQGYNCPRKALINSEIEIVELDDESVLLNSNTQENKKEVFEYLTRKNK